MITIEASKAIDYIRAQLTQEELLAQLAEEATELAHAALKLRRVYDGTNPTPINLAEALDTIHEEIADVYLVVELLQLDQNVEKIGCIMRAKLARWQKRLEEKESKE